MTDPNFAFTLEATSGMARLGRVETSRAILFRTICEGSESQSRAAT